jgi:hypothetical protein
MMVPRSICLASVLLTVVSAFKNSFVSRGWSNVLSLQGNAKVSSFKSRGWMSMMSDAADVAAVATTSSLVGAKAFGVFVDITGINVLLPRSQMTKGNYEKLKRMADSKSKEQVRLELIGVSAENSTLSGKYISANYKNRPDLSALEGTDISTKFFNATVVGAHDFGIFAELDDYGVEGLVPASKLPERMPSGSIQSSYP